MATVAIIHAAEDALPARALAEKLRLAKLTVVLEKEPGEDLRGAVKDAKVTVALWSPRSVEQQPLIEDAVFARGKSKLVHAVMQNTAAPDQFRNDPSVNLTGWRGEDDFQAWRDLAKLVTDRAHVSPLPPPTPRPASGFFQPGAVRADAQVPTPGPPMGRSAARSAPQQPRQQQRAAPAQPRPQRAPQPASAGGEPKKSGAGLMIGIAAVVVLGLAGGGYYFYSQSQGATSTSAAWESIDQNDAGALRAFISGDPGDFRDEARAALASLEERSFEAASDSDTIEALEAFLNDFPESQHAIVARGRIAELQTVEPAAPQPEVLDLPPVEDAPSPDLVPPNATVPGGDAGPAPLTPPPAPDESTTPDDAPVN
jgi:hypothetical protein